MNFFKFFLIQGKNTLTLIGESWGKNPKRGSVTERVFRKKKSRTQQCIDLYIILCYGFFTEIAFGDGPTYWILFQGFTDMGQPG